MADLILAKFSVYFRNPDVFPSAVSEDSSEPVFLLGNCRNFGDGSPANQNRCVAKAGGWHLLTWIKPELELQWKHCICQVGSHEIRIEEGEFRSMKIPEYNADFAFWMKTDWEDQTFTVTEVPIEEIMEEDEDLMDAMTFEEPGDDEIADDSEENNEEEEDNESVPDSLTESNENLEYGEVVDKNQLEMTDGSEQFDAKYSPLPGGVQDILRKELTDSFEETKSKSEASTDSEIVAILSGRQRLSSEQEMDEEFAAHCREPTDHNISVESAKKLETQASEHGLLSDEETFDSEDAMDAAVERTPKVSVVISPDPDLLDESMYFIEGALSKEQLETIGDRTTLVETSSEEIPLEKSTDIIKHDDKAYNETLSQPQPSEDININVKKDGILSDYELSNLEEQNVVLQNSHEELAVSRESINNDETKRETGNSVQATTDYILTTTEGDVGVSKGDPYQLSLTEEDCTIPESNDTQCVEENIENEEVLKNNILEKDCLSYSNCFQSNNLNISNTVEEENCEKDKRTVDIDSDIACEGEAETEARGCSPSAAEKFTSSTSEYPRYCAVIETGGNLADESQRQASEGSVATGETLYYKENNSTCQSYSSPESTQLEARVEQKEEICATVVIDSSVVQGDIEVTDILPTNETTASELLLGDPAADIEELPASSTSSGTVSLINSASSASTEKHFQAMETSEMSSNLPATNQEVVEDEVVDSFMPSVESKCPSTQTNDVEEEDVIIKPKVVSQTESTCPPSSIVHEEDDEGDNQELMEARVSKVVSSRPVSEYEELAYGSMDETSQEMTSSIDGRGTDMSSEMTSSGVAASASMCTSHTADSFAPTGFTSGDDTPHLDEEDENELDTYNNGMAASESGHMNLEFENKELHGQPKNEECDQSSGGRTPSTAIPVGPEDEHDHTPVREVLENDYNHVAQAPVVESLKNESVQESVTISQEIHEEPAKDIHFDKTETAVEVVKSPKPVVQEAKLESKAVMVEKAGPPLSHSSTEEDKVHRSPVVVGVNSLMERSDDELKTLMTLRSKVIVNDDYKYPDSVTPTKVEHFTSTDDYDVPYIDDEAFYCEDWYVNEDQRWSWLDKNFKADFDECTLTAAVHVLESSPQDGSRNSRSWPFWKKSPHTSPDGKPVDGVIHPKNQPLDNKAPTRRRGLRNLCGCVSRQRR